MPDPSSTPTVPPAPNADTNATTDAILDPFTVLDQLIALTETRISDFERQPDQLTPRQIELAIIHTITGIMRTTNHLARLLEDAAKAPHSTAFDNTIAHFSASIARSQARLRELETYRRLDQLPWLARERLRLRYEAVQERLRLAQAQLRRRAEIHQERQRQRTQQQQERASRAAQRALDRHPRDRLLEPDPTWSDDQLPDDTWPDDLPEQADPQAQPAHSPAAAAPTADMVRIADPYTPTGWRLLPRARLPKDAHTLS